MVATKGLSLWWSMISFHKRTQDTPLSFLLCQGMQNNEHKQPVNCEMSLFSMNLIYFEWLPAQVKEHISHVYVRITHSILMTKVEIKKKTWWLSNCAFCKIWHNIWFDLYIVYKYILAKSHIIYAQNKIFFQPTGFYMTKASRISSTHIVSLIWRSAQ